MEEGDPEYRTDEALSSLSEFVAEVMVVLSESGEDNLRIQSFSNDTG